MISFLSHRHDDVSLPWALALAGVLAVAALAGHELAKPTIPGPPQPSPGLTGCVANQFTQNGIAIARSNQIETLARIVGRAPSGNYITATVDGHDAVQIMSGGVAYVSARSVDDVGRVSALQGAIFHKCLDR